jgi:hypothetical protein
MLLLAILTSFVCSYLHIDVTYSFILAFIIITALGFSNVGIYTGFKYKTDLNRSRNLNRIGFLGNIIFFLIVHGLILITLFAKK